MHARIAEYGINNPLTKSEFVNEICSTWHKGMTKENAISGFETTGINHSTVAHIISIYFVQPSSSRFSKCMHIFLHILIYYI